MENYSVGESEALSSEITKAKGAGRLFSRFFLSLFIYLLVSYAIVYAVNFIVAIFFGAYYEAITQNPYFSLTLSAVAMYLAAFPVMLLMVRRDKTYMPEKKKLSLGEFVIIFLVAEGLMILGSLIGLGVNSLIDLASGVTVPNNTADIVTSSPLWLVSLIVVVIGPVIEELIFRKLMIDRFSSYGDGFAILVSAVAFGLFHQNLYQLFYAALLGLVLGYVYTRTRDIRYPILLHMLINFLGSVISILVQREALRLTELLEGGMEGVNLLSVWNGACALYAYVFFTYGAALAGIIILIVLLAKRRISLRKERPILIGRGALAKALFLNVGLILFALISVLLTLLNVILPIIQAYSAV